jgi:hypothetical protein
MSRQAQNIHHVQNVIAMESAYGLQNLDTYTQWANTVKNNIKNLIDTVDQYRNNGYTLIGYGAAAKGNTLLNFSKIKLDFIIDDNPLKQGKFTPGTQCPIVSIDLLQNFDSDSKLLFVPLAWNFFKEIKSKIQRARSNNNDKFLKYFPTVEVSS